MLLLAATICVNISLLIYLTIVVKQQVECNQRLMEFITDKVTINDDFVELYEEENYQKLFRRSSLQLKCD